MKLIIMSGASGSGKDTAINNIKRGTPLLKLKTITTRGQRVGENPDDYFFWSEEEFLQKLEEGDIWQHVNFAGNYYGSSEAYLETIKDSDDLYYSILTPEGAVSFRDKLKEYNIPILFIYLEVKDKELLKDRITKRGDSEEAIGKRMNQVEAELELAKNCGINYHFIDGSKEAEEVVQLIKDKIKQFTNKQSRKNKVR